MVTVHGSLVSRPKQTKAQNNDSDKPQQEEKRLTLCLNVSTENTTVRAPFAIWKAAVFSLLSDITSSLVCIQHFRVSEHN